MALLKHRMYAWHCWSTEYIHIYILMALLENLILAQGRMAVSRGPSLGLGPSWRQWAQLGANMGQLDVNLGYLYSNLVELASNLDQSGASLDPSSLPDACLEAEKRCGFFGFFFLGRRWFIGRSCFRLLHCSETGICSKFMVSTHIEEFVHDVLSLP